MQSRSICVFTDVLALRKAGDGTTFVRDVDTVVDKLALVNPIVVGHSFGGVLAMAYAAAARKGLERHVGTLAAERANVRLETIDATHWVMFENPDAIGTIIRTFAGA